MEKHQQHYDHRNPSHYYNLYSILGLPCYTSDEVELGKAFLKQSQMYHPNRNSDPRSIAWFQKIEHAYDVLKDQNSRADYDRFLVSSTQQGFNRSQEAATKQHSYYLSWMTSWDRTKQDSKHCLSFHGKSTKSGDNDSLMTHVQALEREVSTLKTANSKLWTQASCHLANADGLRREKAKLQNQIESDFHRRERGYVNRIRFLESTVASLRRSLEKYEGKKKNKSEKQLGVATAPQYPTLIVKLNATQPLVGLSKRKTRAIAAEDNKTPISSNLTRMAKNLSVLAPNKSSTVVKVDNENPKRHQQIFRKNKRPASYRIMPSLMDKENLDDACRINAKRVKLDDADLNQHHRFRMAGPPAKQQQKNNRGANKTFGVAVVVPTTNCIV